MNWNEMKSDWVTVSPMVATYWNRLNPDDLQEINGSREKLADVLCERYRLSPEDAVNQICAFEKEVRRPGAVK